jgi:hypothetical protein
MWYDIDSMKVTVSDNSIARDGSFVGKDDKGNQVRVVFTSTRRIKRNLFIPNIRVNRIEMAHIKKLAAKSGMALTEWIRHEITRGLYEDDHQREVHRLEQLLRMATVQGVSDDDPVVVKLRQRLTTLNTPTELDATERKDK